VPVQTGLSAELGRIQRGIPSFMRRETRYVSQLATREIAQRTPIGKKVDQETGEDRGTSGKLRRGWRPISPRQEGNTYTGGSYNDVDYTRYVEDGTREHIIRAHGIALHFWSKGEEFFRRQVHHPGTRGVFMAERGLKEADRQYGREADARLQAFLDGRSQG
jgi:hypothetical protein